MNRTIRRIIAVLPLFILVATAVAFLYFNQSDQDKTPLDQNADAVAVGKNLSNQKCSGTGAGTLTELPMNLDDFAMIIPYGLVTSGHVTPIDHQYYSPTVFNSPRDTYPVYAMADARLVDIQLRTTERGVEYRMVFTMSCTFLYYYDLVTSLAPDIKAEYDLKKNSQGYATNIDIQVTAGQEIGKIGGQTLDFAVWDTTKPLTGFVNPTSYQTELWKIYTADPLDYVTPEIKQQMISKYLRTVEPISGKIDYDVDGRLIGNWFLEGTNGYAGATGNTGEGYWVGHLSIAPEHIDPTAFIVSFGDYLGEAKQFSIPQGSANPTEVSTATGLVKYELKSWNYIKEDKTGWDRVTFAKNLKLENSNNPSQGCVLFKLVEDQKLKMEAFPGKKCSQVSGFTSAAKFYTR